jgi:spore maturation protein CgeB
LNPAKIRRRHKKDTDKWIQNQIDSFQPDIIFIYSRDIALGVLQQISASSIKTVLYYEDMSNDISPALIQMGKQVGFFLATNKGLMEEYRRAGIVNPIYFVGACDRYDHRRRRPLLPVWKSDIAFIGRARPNEPRVTLTRKLGKQFNVKVYGKAWREFGLRATLKTVTPRGYALICAGAKIMLGADFTSEVEGYWSNRLWLTLGCGGFFLTQYVKGMEKYFENKKHLVWYHNEQECLSLAEEYLSRPRERRKIALEGYRLVHEHHTFHHFVDRVISLCT